MNLYAVLGIPRDADDEAIRRAYRILARRYHPDRGAGSSPEKFRQINEAYETLSDRERRRSYDSTTDNPPAVTLRRPAGTPVEPITAPPESIFQSPYPSRPRDPFRAMSLFDEMLEQLLFGRIFPRR